MNPADTHTETAAGTAGTEFSAEVLATLAEIGEEVNASLVLDEVLARAAALIKRHIDYEIFGVLMFEPDGTHLKHRFAIGYPRDAYEYAAKAVSVAMMGVSWCPVAMAAMSSTNIPI